MKKPVIIAATAVLCAVIGFTGYTLSPGQRAGRAYAAGEEFLRGLDYEQAFGKFREAIEIDSDNKELAENIHSQIVSIVDRADEARSKQLYDEAIEQYDAVAEYAVYFDEKIADDARQSRDDTKREKTKEELLGKAYDDYIAGRFEYAVDEYHKAQDNGATDDEVYPYLELAEAGRLFDKGDFKGAHDLYAKLVDEGAEDEDIQYRMKLAEFCMLVDRYLRSQIFSSLEKLLDQSPDITDNFTEEPVHFGEELYFIKKGNSIIAIQGEFNDTGNSDRAIGFISSVNTNSFYEGEWKNFLPDGSGALSVWTKNETSSNAAIFSGSYKNGMAEGKMRYTFVGEDTTASIQADQGKVKVIETDQKQRVIVARENDGQSYEAVGEKESGGIIKDYDCGVPGFGGSDKKLIVKIVDDEPPVFHHNLELNKKYRWKEIKDDITATDNVDGDLTKKIQLKTGDEDVFSVKDSMGNEARMIMKMKEIKEVVDYGCGDVWIKGYWYVITSIRYENDTVEE